MIEGPANFVMETEKLCRERREFPASLEALKEVDRIPQRHNFGTEVTGLSVRTWPGGVLNTHKSGKIYVSFLESLDWRISREGSRLAG